MKITYFASAGTADPTRASIPLHLAANGSLEVGQETAIILGGDAAELLLDDNAEQLEGVACRRCESCSPSCATTPCPSTSERAAPSPVGRPTRICRRSAGAGSRRPTSRDCSPKATAS
jgi:hypothetical protein